MTRFTALLAAAAALVAARGTIAHAADDAPHVVDVVGYPAAAGERPHGIYMVIPPQHDRAADAPSSFAGRWIFFLNRDGGTYVPGPNDARTNQSSIPTQPVQIPPWAVSDQDWQQVVACVRQQFAAYDVEITDTDPRNIPHIESVVGGRARDMQLPPGVGGVSPFRSDCGTIDNSIVFTFADDIGGDLSEVCDVIAQEVAHSFGLDHALLPADPMTYLPFSGQRAFQNQDAQCGEEQARVCACGAITQNSVQLLAQRVGLRAPGVDPIAPQVSIAFPDDGALVGPGFQVAVDASDDVRLVRVELYVDGVAVTALVQPPFDFVTARDLTPGVHTVETRAYDADNISTTTIAVTVDPNAPTSPGTPGGGDNPVLTGGCSAGADSGNAGGLLALLALGLLAIGRRRG